MVWALCVPILLHRLGSKELGAPLTVSVVERRGLMISNERGSLAGEIVINKPHKILWSYFQNQFLLCSS